MATATVNTPTAKIMTASELGAQLAATRASGGNVNNTYAAAGINLPTTSTQTVATNPVVTTPVVNKTVTPPPTNQATTAPITNNANNAGTYDPKTGIFSLPGATAAQRAVAASAYYKANGMQDKATAADNWIKQKKYDTAPSAQFGYTAMPEYQNDAVKNYAPVVDQLDSVVSGYQGLIAQAQQQGANIQAMIAAQLEGALSMLDSQQASFTERLTSQMGADDPAIQAAIKILRESVALERDRLNEDLNARGLAQSGIVLEMNSRLSNNQLSQEEQLIASRVSELTTQLNEGLMQLMNARIGLHTQYGGMAVNAQMANNSDINTLGAQGIDAQANAINAQQAQQNWWMNYQGTEAQNAWQRGMTEQQFLQQKNEFDTTTTNALTQQEFENQLALRQLAMSGSGGGSGGGGSTAGLTSTAKSAYEQAYAELVSNHDVLDWDAAYNRMAGSLPYEVRLLLEEDRKRVYNPGDGTLNGVSSVWRDNNAKKTAEANKNAYPVAAPPQTIKQGFRLPPKPNPAYATWLKQKKAWDKAHATK